MSKGDRHERTTAHHPIIPVKELELLGEELDMASAVPEYYQTREGEEESERAYQEGGREGDILASGSYDSDWVIMHLH